MDNWTKANNRPFGSQCEAACSLARKLRVKLRLKTNGDFQNVYIQKRDAEADGKSAKFGEAELKAAAAAGAADKQPFAVDGAASPAQQPPSDSPIPF